ncbi:MAG: HAMP domain-containing sensor histidine kinase [Chloroflexota bacterium]
MSRDWRHLGGYRLRLGLAFGVVVLLGMGIVVATLPRLLDDYLRQQELSNLESRTSAVARLITERIATVTNAGQDYQLQVLNEAVTPTQPSFTLLRALGRPTSGFIADLTSDFALADVHVEVFESEAAVTAGEPPVLRFDAPLTEPAPEPGQRREKLSANATSLVKDGYWTQTEGRTPERPVVVTLSNPYTSRQQTISTVDQVLLIAVITGLLAAGLIALALTQWLADPIRRLTRASRQLAEGHLETRVALPATAAPEVTELGDAFNQMADRLGESITVITTDRDRSRDFVADVSHELRTPIAALRTFNELLRAGAVNDPEARDEFLEQSARQIERMEWLATNLLELSKLDSGLVRLDLRVEDLRGVVESAYQQAEPVAGRKGVELELHLPLDPVRLPHDPPRLGQVLTNLIGNAIKFTAKGGRVDVALVPVPEGAAITVSDTGVGIPADELPHVFERFWRGARTRERGSGSGLGLSIAKSIVDMHEGRIQVVSTPNVGTQITVILPGRVSISSPPAGAA